MRRFVAIETNGEIEIHMQGAIGDYVTLCGMDGDDPDPAVNQRLVESTAKKVTCRDCIAIWQVAHRYKPYELQRP